VELYGKSLRDMSKKFNRGMFKRSSWIDENGLCKN